jgi:hypothetical protein
MSNDSTWNSYAPPSQFANSPQEAHEIIQNGDYWEFDQIGISGTGVVMGIARAANASDWKGYEKAMKPVTYRPRSERATVVVLGIFAVLVALVSFVAIYGWILTYPR